MVNDGKKPLADESRIRKLVERGLKEEENILAEQSQETSIDALRRQVAARNQEAKQQARDIASKGGDKAAPFPLKFIMDCLDANEVGDGILFSYIHNGRFLRNSSSGEELRWAGHHWETDEQGEALAAVEDVVLFYLEAAAALVPKIAAAGGEEAAKPLMHQQKELYRRARRLRTVRGRINCLEMAAVNPVNPMQVSGDLIDQKKGILSCPGGAIDLRTGDLRGGRPEDYLLKASPVAYEGIDAQAPLWEKTLLEIFSGDQELVDCLGRALGYALSGECTLAKLIVLSGRGRNGKGLIIETVLKVLGPLAKPIPAEMLLDQGGRSAAAPSPDILSLKGVRIAIASETDAGRRISPSRVKWLTGRDTLVARAPHDRRETVFTPTHTLFLLTNAKPKAPAHDFALWERLLLFPFKLSFVDREPREDFEVRADPLLPKKLEAEYPGILAWLVRGCLAFQDRGLDPPAVVRNATADYRRDEDLLADFLEQSCAIDRYSEAGATDLYGAFREWWGNNVSKRPPSQKTFGEWMSAKFQKGRAGTGRIVYYGLSLLSNHF